MKIKTIDIYIEFESDIVFTIPPSFYFRSLLGKELRKSVCLYLKKNLPCDECHMQNICNYAQIFESPISKDNPYLKGRTRAPHPFVLYTDAIQGKKYKHIHLSLIIMGGSIKFFPLLVYAIIKGGKIGVFRDKIKYKILDIVSEGEKVFIDEEHIIPPEATDFQNYPFEMEPGKQSIKIEFVTPFRFKKDGKYLSENLTYTDVLLAAQRRARILFGLYGNQSVESLPELNGIPQKEEKVHLVWENWDRYSRRQNTEMSLGGLIGMLYVKGEFLPEEIFYLKAASLFHIGKNTGFGLGKILCKKINNGGID